VHLWDFAGETAVRGLKLSENQLVAASFNAVGDRVLCVDSLGWAVLTDFEKSVEWRLTPGDSARWLNADNQFAVASPDRGDLCIYDLLAGEDPVVCWPLGSDRRCGCVDVWRAAIAVGFDDGVVVLFDARMGVKTASLPLHTQQVTCLRYDESGTFFITGSSDNSVNVVEASDSYEIRTFSNIIGEYDPESSTRGVLTLALSHQAIVAAGAAAQVHVWTINDASTWG
jgi:WD40 repeat protein